MDATSLDRGVKKPISLRRFSVAASLAIALIALLLGVLEAREFQKENGFRERMEQSYRTRAHLAAILSHQQEVETAEHGFLATGNRDFLDRYRTARARMAPAAALLADEMRERPKSARATSRLTQLSDRSLGAMDRAVLLREQGDADSAARFIASREYGTINGSLRGVVADLEAIELRHLAAIAERSEVGEGNGQRAVEAALLLLLLVIAAWIAGRSIAATHLAVDRLHDLSARQEAILLAATDGVMTHDPKGIIEGLNPAMARIYGYEPDELCGRHIGILFQDPPSQAALEGHLADLVSRPKGDAPPTREFQACRRDGSVFTVDVSTNPVLLGDGPHFVAIVRDITARKQIEQMKTEFVSTVSHELRTPLTSIGGALGLLAGGAVGALPEPAARLIAIAQANSERLVRLINDILDMEKIESGKMAFRIAPVSLRALAEQAIQANLAFAAQYGVTLRLAAGSPDAIVLGDADRLMQVLTNLLSNAAKFSPRGEEVRVRIEPGDATHRIVVSDTGAGIPLAFQDRIFSRFAQAESPEAHPQGGTGLGLSIAKEIVTRLGGSIGFETRAGQGTSFHLDLPAGSAAAPARPRILVCQGDEAATGNVRRLLRRAGFDCDTAANDGEVRALVGAASYAAVLLDMALSGEGAVALIRHLRSDPRYATVPILVASSDAPTGRMSQALEILDWLHKPVSADALVEGMREIRPTGERPAILHLEDDSDVLEVVAGAFDGVADLTSVADLLSARAALAAHHFDLVILDLALPVGSGLDLLPELRRADGTPIPVVIFSAHEDDPELASRVEAMLTKSRASIDELIAVVRSLIAKAAGKPSGED